MKKILHFSACALFAFSNQALAVFCTAQEYIHPTTGKSVWFFGDIHCDVDPEYTMTRLQQHTLLDAAKQFNATIIAENIDCSFYSPYSWIIPFSIDAALLYKAFKDSSYKYLIAGISTTALHSTLWYASKSKTQKPTVNLTDQIAYLKKNSLVPTLPCYAASPLWSLVQEAEKRGIPAVNLEFRYHMVPAYNHINRNQLPWLLQGKHIIAQTQYWLNRTVTGNKVRYPLTLHDYCHVNDGIMAEIKHYNTEPRLHDFYQKCIESYSTSYMTVALQSLAQKNPSLELATIIPTLVTHTNKDTATIVRDFAEHNMTLFDARLINSIVSHKNTNIFVCTGAYHVSALIKILEQLGYQARSMHGNDNLKTLTEKGAIGRTFIQLDDLDYLAIDLDKVFVKA